MSDRDKWYQGSRNEMGSFSEEEALAAFRGHSSSAPGTTPASDAPTPQPPVSQGPTNSEPRCPLCGNEGAVTFDEEKGTATCRACAKILWPLVDIYDSELRELGRVQDDLMDQIGSAKDLEAFRKKSIADFEKVGFVVRPKVWATTESGTYAFDYEILGRTEEFDWDPDRMVHEVTNDLLETGDGGVINTGKFNPFK